MRTVFRSKATFSHPEDPLRAAFQFVRNENRAGCVKPPPRGAHWGRPPTLFSATMLRRHSETKAQSCSGVALLLCFNVAARPAAPLTCRLVRLGATQTRQRPAKGLCAGGESVLHQDGGHTGGLYIQLTTNHTFF